MEPRYTQHLTLHAEACQFTILFVRLHWYAQAENTVEPR